MNAFQTIVMTFLLLTNRTPTHPPSVTELLDKYAETQDKLRSSFISKLEIDLKFEAYAKARPNIKPGKTYRKRFKIELRSDGERSYDYIKMWGDRPGSAPATEAKAQHSHNLWDGRFRYKYIIHPHLADDPGKLSLYDDWPKFAWKYTRGRALRGYFPGVRERIDTELRQARTLSVESQTDGTNGSQLYVISGKAKGSEFQIWIDPEHGHNIAKAIVKRAWASWSRPEEHSKHPPKGHATMWLNNVRFSQVDGLWVPVYADYRREHRYVTGEYEKSQFRIEITDFVVNPDHAKLDSFGNGFIRNGAEIKSYVDRNNGFHYAWDPQYLWQSEAKIVADRNGNLIRYEPQKKLFPVVKQIPELRYLRLKNMERKVEDKSILLCFCDTTQPASQQCVKVIKEQIPGSDSVVAAIVNCPGGAVRNRSKARLDRSSFPIGVIDRNADKLLRAWGVKQLPHLVLTDKNHIVIAEGFGVDELDSTISEMVLSARVPADSNKVTGLVKDTRDRPLSGVHVTEFQTDKDYITDKSGKFTSAFGPSSERRFFFAVDKKLSLVGVGMLPTGEKHVEIKLMPGKMVSGTVVDPDGKPVTGAQVAPLPMTCFYVLTNSRGKFDLGWNPEWAGDLKKFFLMARHLGRNLAGGIEFDRNTETVRIELEPALMLTGTVEEPNGVPIRGAEVGLSLRRGWACGTPVVKVITDEKGRYTFPVLPQRQEYINYAEADGFWRNQITTGIINRITDCEQVGPIILKRPILSVSGVVLNANGDLVADIPVHLKGKGQPYLDTKTDTNGKFIFEKVCSGPVQISAKTDTLFGKIETEGGIKNVKLVVRPRFE